MLPDCSGWNSLSRRLDECDFVDFLQRGEPATNSVEGGLAEERHAFSLSELADLRGRLLFKDQLTDGVGQVQKLMNCGTSSVPGAAALDASGAFAEGEAAPFGGIHAAGDEDFIGITDVANAMLADSADEALGEDAVQCGDEVVGFNAHVEEASEDVDDIVGVDGGEDEVASQSGVDGDLGGFLVTDFADEDLVGVVAEDGAQAAGEGEAFFLVYRDLGDTADLVFDRVFDGDDLVFVALDFIEGGVEGGGFAGAGGTGDEHHAVGLAD